MRRSGNPNTTQISPALSNYFSFLWFRKRAVLVFQPYILKCIRKKQCDFGDYPRNDWGWEENPCPLRKPDQLWAGNCWNWLIVREGLGSLALDFRVCLEFSLVKSFKNFHGVPWADEEIHCYSFPDQPLRPGLQGTWVPDRGSAWREVVPRPRRGVL